MKTQGFVGLGFGKTGGTLEKLREHELRELLSLISDDFQRVARAAGESHVWVVELRRYLDGRWEPEFEAYSSRKRARQVRDDLKAMGYTPIRVRKYVAVGGAV